MTERTRPCSAAARKGRFAKARQFADTARLIEDDDELTDSYVTNCVHAGIAAADVICCARLGKHASGQNHEEAAALLLNVDKQLAKDLSTLLGMKTAAGYSQTSISAAKAKQAGRAMERLVDAAAQEV